MTGDVAAPGRAQPLGPGFHIVDADKYRALSKHNVFLQKMFISASFNC